MGRAFTGPDADVRYERAGHFLLAAIFGNAESRTWCDRKGIAFRKAQSEGIGSAGGFLVPTELANAILDLRDSYGAFRRRALIYPMGSDSTVFARRTGTATAAFISEGVAAGAATTNMDAVNLTAKKLGALVTVSSELDEDSIVDLVDYVADEMAQAIAAVEDDCAFNGTGASAYGGIRGCTVIANDGSHSKAKVTAASGHNTYALLDQVDLGSLVGQVRASAIPNAAWFVSQSGYANTMVRLNTVGGGLLETRMIDGVYTPYFNGFPVILTQKLPLTTTSITTQAMMAFGDMRAAAVLGQRRGITIARSDQRYMDTDQIGILATERFDAVIHDLGDNQTAGSLAVLFAP